MKQMSKLFRTLKTLWELLREACGENAYARYCRYVVARGGQPLSPQAFYLAELERKHSRPARCC